MRSAEFRVPNYPVLDGLEVSEHVLANWQVTVDLLAEVAEVPVALIRRVRACEIEVLVTSHSPGNVYHPGAKALLETGSYCEKVVSSRREVRVPNALKDPAWDPNADIKLGMISYCGLPLTWPNGELFGTICLLDTRENAYSKRTCQLMERFRDSIQAGLVSIYQSSLARGQRNGSERTLRSDDEMLAIMCDIATRQQAETVLRASQERFHDLFQQIPSVAIQGYAPDGTTQYWNQASEQLYGYPAAEAIGRNLLDLIIPPEMQAAVAHAMQQMAVTGQPIPPGELSLMCKDRSRVTVFSSHAILQLPGRPQELFCIDIDLTARKQAEAAIQLALVENTALIQEIHHRVKNNLAIMVSLINMQTRRIKHPEALTALADTKARLLAMSLLHEMLYRSGRMDRVEVKGYLESLCGHLEQTLGVSAQGVQIQSQLSAVLTMQVDQAVPCGLIVSELVSNAIKHAFPETRKGEIMVELVVEEPDVIILRVTDNGIGLPVGMKINQVRSVGLTLVHTLTRQLRGVLEIRREHGTRFEIRFPLRSASPS